MVCEFGNLLNGSFGGLTTNNPNTPEWMRTNVGEDYIGNGFKSWIKQSEIVHEITEPYSLESYGAAERLD